MSGLVGSTPLLRLQRSGEGRVVLKHEGYQPGGSFFDRVARALFERTRAESVVIAGGDAFAVSVATVAAARGARAQVVVAGDSWRRVATLLDRLGASVAEVDDADVDAAVQRALAGGATRFRRDDPTAVSQALGEVAAEVRGAIGRPALWVMPDYGLDPRAVAESLGDDVFLELIADDREVRRSISGADACRRAQVGQREGILLSPLGAEIVEASINAAPEVEGLVVALVPEGGHRYLGWW